MSDKAYTRLLLETNRSVLTIVMNRPEVHNAFDEVVLAELTSAILDASADPTVRIIVLTGAGASFCAGADLAWMSRMASYSREENLEDARLLQKLFLALYRCPKITLARVGGVALGGGAGLVAACDLALVSNKALFGFTEARLGLAPAVIAPYVVEKIGIGAARTLFVSGERFSAEEAKRLGLVQEVVEPDELDYAVTERCKALLKVGPCAVGAIKNLLRDIAGQTPEQSAETTLACIADLRVSPEGQEGLRAFLEKRPPKF